MPSTRTWLGLALSVAAAAGMFFAGRLLFYSWAPAQEDDIGLARRIIAYNRIPCPDIQLNRGFGEDLSGYGEGTMTLRCRDGTRFVAFSQTLCSQTLACRYVPLLCWRVEKA